MALTAMVYYAAATSLANKEIDWGTDTVRVMLVSNSYLPSQSTHRYKSDVNGEVTGTGYTERGQELTNKTEAFSGSVKRFKADNAVWSNATITARGAVVYVDTTVDGTSPLLCYIGFGKDVSSTNAEFTIDWDTDGIMTMTVQ